MANLWHFLAHLFRMNGCNLVRETREDGHEWLFTECAGCGIRHPLAHSSACHCHPAPVSSPEGEGT